MVLEGPGREGVGRAGTQQNGSFSDLFLPASSVGSGPMLRGPALESMLRCHQF